MSLSEMNGKKISLWNFLEENNVVIPIIQRDYAQGRRGKESLRKRFIKDLKKALDKKEELILDFVYGSEDENGNLQPLDGQQRLTTLWLLHWYIAYKAERIEEAKEKLSKFTYKTRRPAEDFCETLSAFDNLQKQESQNISEYIKDLPWFENEQEDPTVLSMLNMLGGTEKDLLDGIELLFNKENTTQEKYVEYWEELTSDKAPIVFYSLSLKDFNLSDDLYVKMNARGKQLENFENFKADLIDYIGKQAENDSEWKKLLYPEAGSISIDVKMDTKWTDIFWRHRSNENRIDEIYFAFMNRFFWNEIFTLKKIGEKDYAFKVDDFKKNQSFTQFDSEAAYEDLEKYKYFERDSIKEIPLQLFKDLQKVLDNYFKYTKDKDKDKEIPYTKWMNDFKFIPEINPDDGEISDITQQQRVLFFALCKYFKEEEEKEDANPSALKSWMHVVCNLVSGRDRTGQSQVRTEGAIREVIRYIEELKSHDVYNSDWKLEDDERFNFKGECEDENETAVFNFVGKCQEEMVKAKKIRDDKTWEEKLQKTEEYSFFNGTIRFLFQGENGQEDWDDFDNKWKKVQEYFNDDNKKKRIDLLKDLFSRFSETDFENVIWEKNYHNKSNVNILSNRDLCWHYYLVNPLICGPVDGFLLNKKMDKKLKLSKNFSENEDNDTLYYLSKTNLLDIVVDQIPDAWIHYVDNVVTIIDHGSWKKKKGRFIFLDTHKYDYLKDVTITNELYAISGTKLHFEFSDIFFDYEGGHYLRWGEDRWIYLQTDDNPEDSEIKNEKEKDNHKKYYCFDPDGKDKNEILKNLKNLKKLADSKKK